MQLTALGISTDRNEDGIRLISAEAGRWIEAPLDGITANEMARDCFFFLLEADVPEKWLEAENIETKISDALQRNDTQEYLEAINATCIHAASEGD